MWGNLKKSGDMEIGQVGFHDEKAVCEGNKERENGEWRMEKWEWGEWR